MRKSIESSKFKRFFKHEKLNFIIGCESNCIYKAAFAEEEGWINVDESEVTLIKGKVIYDEVGTWGVGHEADCWARNAFIEVGRLLIISLDVESKSWTVIDLVKEAEEEGSGSFEGGWYEIMPGVVSVEWDSDYPDELYDPRAEEPCSLGEMITDLIDVTLTIKTAK